MSEVLTCDTISSASAFTSASVVAGDTSLSLWKGAFMASLMTLVMEALLCSEVLASDAALLLDGAMGGETGSVCVIEVPFGLKVER